MEFLQSTFLLLFLSNLFISTLTCRNGYGTLLASGVTEVDKQEILHAHNEMRQKVALGQVDRQPGAENMIEFTWDDQLAQIAQQWADLCDFSHTPDRDIPGRFDYGQNLGRHRSTLPPAPSESNQFIPRINDWYNEHKIYKFSTKFNEYAGHYTQLVWAESHLLGCGFSLSKRGNRYVRIYVCNYGPGGNTEDEYPYKKGEPSCSKYNLKPSQWYYGLCQAGGSEFLDSNSIAQQEQSTYQQYVPTVNYEIPQPQPQPKSQAPIIQTQAVEPYRQIVITSAPDSSYHTYQWGDVFNSFFKTYNSYRYGKK